MINSEIESFLMNLMNQYLLSENTVLYTVKKNRDFLKDYSNNTRKVIEMKKRNIIVDNYQQLEKLVEQALNSNLNNALHLGEVSENNISRIKLKLQNLPNDRVDILSKKSYDLVINQSEIRHLASKTGLSLLEIKKYVMLLPKIITESDYITYTKNKNEGLRFKKITNEGTYISFLTVSNKKNTLLVKSVFLDKKSYEKKKLISNE